jgi:excisionase family DNA binding protein
VPYTPREPKTRTRASKAPRQLSPAALAAIYRKGLWPINEVADYLAIDRSHVYALISRGQLHIVKQGRRSYIAADDLVAYLTQLPDADQAEATG